MVVREGHLETLDRHRTIFEKALLDGIGKPDAGADFYLSAMNAERHGYILSKHDESLINMFSSVLLKDEQQPTGPSAVVNLEQEGQMGATGGKEFGFGGPRVYQQDVASAIGHGAGMQEADDPSYQYERIVPPEPGQGLASRQFEMHDGHEDDPYRTHNYIGSDMNPLHDNMHAIVGDFYEHDEEGNSQSQIDANKELAWERHHSDDASKSWMLNQHQYGQLEEGATNHAIYEHDYNNWKHQNPDIIPNYNEQELRRMHLEQSKSNWQRNLGFMDYLLGLEWLNPEQRNEVYEHLSQHGATNKNKPLRIEGSPVKNWIPRLVRNFHQRFSGLYNHWVRDPSGQGEAIMHKDKPEPEDAAIPLPAESLAALKEHVSPGKEPSWERALRWYEQHQRNFGNLNFGIDRGHVPAPETVKDNDGNIIGQRIVWKPNVIMRGDEDTKQRRGLSSAMFRYLLGIDEDGQLLQKHPEFSNTKWQPGKEGGTPFTQDEINEIVNLRLQMAKKSAAASRIGKNSIAFHTSTHVHPEYSPEYAQDDNETLATHWHKPFAGMGGLHKLPNELFKLLHGHTELHDKVKSTGGKQQKIDLLNNEIAQLNQKISDGKEAGSNVSDLENQLIDKIRNLQLVEEFGEDTDEFEYKISQSKQNKRGKNSLFFTRSPFGIYTRHPMKLSVVQGQYEDDFGMVDISSDEPNMKPFLGPFGQPSLETTQMREGGKEGKSITSSARGDPTDAESIGSPHNAGYSKRKGLNIHTERHMISHSPQHDNKIHEDHHRSRLMGDNEGASMAQQILSGKRESIGAFNPFISQGQSFSHEDFLTGAAHAGHSKGMMLGLGRPPMSPAQNVFDLRDNRTRQEGHGTLHYPSDIDTVLDRPERMERIGGEFDIRGTQVLLEEKLKELNEEKERRLSRPDLSEEEKRAIEEEFVRRASLAEKRYTYEEKKDGKEEVKRVSSKLHEPTMSREHPEFLQGESLREASKYPHEPMSQAESDYMQLIDEQSGLTEKIRLGTASEEEIKRHTEMNDMIDNLERQMFGGEEMQPFGVYRGRPGSHDDRVASKLRSDTSAIAQAGKHLQNNVLSPDEMAHIFNPDLPLEVIEGNMRNFARLANHYLTQAPHSDHGIMTTGMGEFNDENASKFGEIVGHAKNATHQSPNSISLSNLPSRMDLLRYLAGEEELQSKLETAFAEAHEPMFNFRRGNKYTRQMLKDLFHRLKDEDKSLGGMRFPAMTMRQYLEQHHDKFQDTDMDKSLQSLRQNVARDNVFHSNLTNVHRHLGQESAMEHHGLHYIPSYNEDGRHGDMTTKDSKFGSAKKTGARNQDQYHNAEKRLNSLLLSDPNKEPQGEHVATKRGMGTVPVDRFGPDAPGLVHSIYNSSGFRHEFGRNSLTNFDFKVGKNGEVSIEMLPEPKRTRLVQPLETFWNSNAPNDWNMKRIHPTFADERDSLNALEHMAAQFKVDSLSNSRHRDPHSFGKSHMGLADLTNPDIIRKEFGKGVPLLQPMHRIFKIEDLEHLRGFTGDWIVSAMPEGERGFVEKEDDEVSSKSFKLSDEDKENFKKVTDEDFHADVVKLDDGYYIFDVLKFADKEVNDVPLNDRIKILRGGMEGVENIHVPSASDTRLTDDEGLKAIVEDLSKNHETLLLRDAKSTYMVGELRHPKWVMLRQGQDVVLRVLERRGNGPYTYRLGTGPITQEEKIGSRAVESKGDTYMDVGVAFNSPDKYNEGDHVRVNAPNVSKVESSDGETIYTLTGSEIQGEAEGEGLVSRETLGLLAKSEPARWLCEVQRASTGIRVMMPQGDVVYKATNSGQHWAVHSPLADNNYLIRLAESQRVYWSPVAAALLKADVEIKEEVHETEGEGEPLIEPKKVEDTNWWKEKQKTKVLVKGLQLIERLMKSGVGAVGQSSTGTMGLGIDYATPIESPMGPTNLNDRKTMPDFDNRKYEGEDSSIEPDEEEELESKHMVIPVKEGVLEVSGDKATLHT